MLCDVKDGGASPVIGSAEAAKLLDASLQRVMQYVKGRPAATSIKVGARGFRRADVKKFAARR